MHSIVKNKFINDIKLRMYIRDNSYYYKEINRKPEKIELIEREMKEKYGLRFSDKINKFNSVIDLLNIIKSDYMSLFKWCVK